MTAEIAIFNKSAVALAADSAVTKGQKIYQTVNKLFALSTTRPVGVMVFGHAEFMDVPWETIIKLYRERLGEKSFPRLVQYAGDFRRFLEKRNPLFSQEEYFSEIVRAYFGSIRMAIDEKVKAIIDAKGKISAGEHRKVIGEEIHRRKKLWDGAKALPTFAKNYWRMVSRRYKRQIKEARESVFEKQPLTRGEISLLDQIASSIPYKAIFPESCSGVVVAGFGEKETFPGYVANDFDMVLNNRLKFRKTAQGQISFSNNAMIVPFAQDDVVFTFMEGVDYIYQQGIEDSVTEVLNKFSDFAVKESTKRKVKFQKALERKLKKTVNPLVSSLHDILADYRRRTHVQPIVEAVELLPKDELAAMAESLVNLTSFKRRVSMDVETVGGPIDVAVISKGDGLVWIKRKHYFKPELNPQFIGKYYRPTKERRG